MRITTLPRILASKVVPDSDLDLRPYGVVAAFSRAPSDSTAWPVQALLWDMTTVPAGNVIHPLTKLVYTNGGKKLWEFSTPPGAQYTYTFVFVTATGDPVTVTITAGGTLIYTSPAIASGATHTVSIPIRAGVDVVCYGNSGPNGAILVSSTYQCDGTVGGAIYHDLAGKWLALGLQLPENTTITIQGVEVPYTDYTKYFPLAPTAITVPGDWGVGSNPPVIEVYA